VKSSVNWAVLGLLIEKPSYGYELSKRYERSYGAFLPVGTSHIYEALKSLEKRSLIEPMPAELTAGTRRQPKVHYRATAKGAREYRHWLARTMRDDSQRHELLGRLLSVSAVDTDALLTILDRYEQECLAEQASLPTPVEEQPEAATSPARALARRLASELRRVTLHADLMWIDWARAEIRAGADRRTSWAPAEADESAVA
jgi:DNA-binding PadR family transcriptional regulator